MSAQRCTSLTAILPFQGSTLPKPMKVSGYFFIHAAVSPLSIFTPLRVSPSTSKMTPIMFRLWYISAMPSGSGRHLPVLIGRPALFACAQPCLARSPVWMWACMSMACSN